MIHRDCDLTKAGGPAWHSGNSDLTKAVSEGLKLHASTQLRLKHTGNSDLTKAERRFLKMGISNLMYFNSRAFLHSGAECPQWPVAANVIAVKHCLHRNRMICDQGGLN